MGRGYVETVEVAAWGGTLGVQEISGSNEPYSGLIDKCGDDMAVEKQTYPVPVPTSATAEISSSGIALSIGPPMTSMRNSCCAFSLKGG